MKSKIGFFFSALIAGSLQAASEGHLPKKAAVQPAVAVIQPEAPKLETPKSELEQPVTDSIGLAIAAGAGLGVAWGVIDVILARPLQPTSLSGFMLKNGLYVISYFASLEVLRNYIEQNKKTRLPRLFLYATCLVMNAVTGVMLSPIQMKVVYNAAGIPTLIPTSVPSEVSARASAVVPTIKPSVQ